jgi:hypothetical protein
MVYTQTLKKESCCAVFVCLIIISLIVVISLILSSCSFTYTSSCSSFDKYSGIVQSSIVGSHYNYGFGNVRYYIVEDITVDTSFNCTRISDSCYESYLNALKHVNTLGSETTVFTDGTSRGCLSAEPSKDNTELIVIVVILFLSLVIFMGYLYQKMKYIITIYKFTNSDNNNDNYNILEGGQLESDDDVKVNFGNKFDLMESVKPNIKFDLMASVRPPMIVSVFGTKQQKPKVGILNSQLNEDIR